MALPRGSLFLIIPSLGYSQEKTESFEGVITYLVEIEYPETYEYEWYINQKYRDTMLLYLSKNGDYLRSFINSDKMGWDFLSYTHSNNMAYAKWRNIDTLYWMLGSDTSIKLKSMRMGGDTTILGYECKSIVIESYFPPEKLNLGTTLYYGGYPKVNPELFRNHKDSFFDIVYAKSKSQFLIMVQDMGYFIITYTAVEIKEKKLNPSFFIPPKNLPRKGLGE